jgi:serine/threonine-protein kinase
MMASRPGGRAGAAAVSGGYDYSGRRGGPVGRWLVVASVLAILTVVVTLVINLAGGEPRSIQIPDVRGQVSADAIAELQNKGFKVRTQQKPDSTVPPDHAIGTDPAGASTVAAGDEIPQRLNRTRTTRDSQRGGTELRRRRQAAQRGGLRQVQTV